jgi:hypothetical protein
VRTTPATPPSTGEPYYFTLFVRRASGPFLQVRQMKLPWRFTASSAITQFAVTPNNDGTANVGLSWLIGVGSTDGVTHYFTLTPVGINVDS